MIEDLAEIILSADIQTVEAVQHRYGEQTSYSSPPTSLDVCLAKTDCPADESSKPIDLYVSNWTDDEKSQERMRLTDSQLAERFFLVESFRIFNEFLFRPYIQTLFDALNCVESDQQCFYSVCVLLTMTTNPCE